MTDVEKPKHQRKVLDEQIQAAEQHELATRLRDTMRRLADHENLPVAEIMTTTLQAWKNKPNAHHTVAEFLEILAATVSAYPGAPVITYDP